MQRFELQTRMRKVGLKAPECLSRPALNVAWQLGKIAVEGLVQSRDHN